MKKIIFIGCIALLSTFCAMAQQQLVCEVYALKYAALARPTPVSDWVQDGPAKDSINIAFVNVSGKVTLVNGDSKEIMPGITVYTGSKHTYESQYVLVQSGKDRILIASDNVWVYDNLKRMLPPPSYGTYNAKAYMAAIQRMKTLASEIDFILPGHDDQLFSKFRRVTDRVVQIK